mgnify:CR=1 FL=1
MSSLSRRNPGQEFAPPVSAYILAYALWFFTCLVGLLVAFAVRDLYQMAMVFTTLDRYAVHLFNQFGVVALVVALTVLVVATEAYYRHGVPRRAVFMRFVRVLGILALLMVATQALRLALEVIAGAVNLRSVLILLIVLLVYTWTRVVLQRHATSPPDAQRRAFLTRVIRVAILVGGATLIALPIKFPINLYDEGLALVNGMRILHGAVPFRDYWSIYPPGQSYVLAALFATVGETVLVERVYDTIVRIVLALVIYVLAARLLRSWSWALAPYVAAAVLLAAATFYGYAVFPALLLGFTALALVFHYVDNHRRRWLVGASVLIGVAACFRLDLGFYAAVSVGVALILLWLLPPSDSHGWGRRTPQLFLDVLAAATPALLLIVAFYGYLASMAGIAVVVDNLLIFPATTFRAVRWLPYPALTPNWSIWSEPGGVDARLGRMFGDYLRFYVPLLVYGVSTLLLLWSAIRSFRAGARFAHTDVMAASLVMMGVGMFVQALSRYDEIHVLPASLVVVILITWLVRQVPRRQWERPLVAAPVLVLLLVPVLLYFVMPYDRLAEYVRQYPPTACFSTVPRAGCVATLPGQEEIVRLLDRQSPDRGPIFSGLLRHDNVFVNDVSIYFLAGRPIATRYHELHPGVTTTRPVQEEMVAEFATHKPEWLVLLTWGNPNEPNASRFNSGVTLLDDYIREHYRKSLTTGAYELWRRQSP